MFSFIYVAAWLRSSCLSLWCVSSEFLPFIHSTADGHRDCFLFGTIYKYCCCEHPWTCPLLWTCTHFCWVYTWDVRAGLHGVHRFCFIKHCQFSCESGIWKQNSWVMLAQSFLCCCSENAMRDYSHLKAWFDWKTLFQNGSLTFLLAGSLSSSLWICLSIHMTRC